LCGRILSGAPAARGSYNPTPGPPLPATPPLSHRFLPAETSRCCFPPLPFLPLFPAEEPASRRSATINRGAVGGGETSKNNSNGRPPGDLGEAEGGGAVALPRRRHGGRGRSLTRRRQTRTPLTWTRERRSRTSSTRRAPPRASGASSERNCGRKAPASAAPRRTTCTSTTPT
jgi:hypothetical protein